MADAAWALVAGFFLAGLVAFRRARRVLTPEARRVVARQPIRTRTRVAVGIAALAVIVWLTRQLFT